MKKLGRFWISLILCMTLVMPLPSSVDAETDVVVRHQFDDGTAQGWGPRGDGVVVEPVIEAARSGSHSLKTSGRTANWHGPALNVKGMLHPGAQYEMTAWVKLAETPDAPSDVKLTVEQKPAGGETGWVTVAQQNIGNTEWVELRGSYSFAEDMEALTLYAESSDPDEVLYLDDVTIRMTSPSSEEPSGQPKDIQQDIPSLKEVLADEFAIGAAVEPYQLNGPHSELLKKHFNVIVAENVMKPSSIQPEEGQFRWEQADQIVQFAREHNMKIRFHTLVWHNQVPDWFFKDEHGNDMTPTEENKQLLLERMETHIRAVVERYGDVIDSWDVVNEVIDPGQPDGMRRSKWYEITGTEYIERAFRLVHELAGEDARLFINDYSTNDPVKRKHLYNLVKQLLDKGVPIDGVGHQMHINLEWPTPSTVAETIDLFAELGLDNQITELDISLYNNSTDSYEEVPEEMRIEQGYRYKEIFDVFKAKSEKISQVVTWGIADDHTWKKSHPIDRLDLPLLFDEQLQAKYAYWGVVDPSRLPIMPQKRDAVKGTPRIDGRAEWIWEAVRATDVRSSEHLSARFETLWDDRYLYVYADVKDATKDKGDRVELFIDENNGKTTAYEEDDRQYTLDVQGKKEKSLEYKIKRNQDGYTLEAAVPMQSAEPGKEIGFDLRITDGNTGTVIAWSDLSHRQHEDTSNFGTLTLQRGIRFADAVPGTPVIDGARDDVWDCARTIATDTWVTGSDGATAKAQVLWDETHLYVWAHVTDPLLTKASENPWEEDSIEIFVDPNNGKTSSYESDDGQYRVNFDNEQSFGGNASAEQFATATKRVADGYVVEAAIRLDPADMRAGNFIGFDIQVNSDDDGDGVRDSVAIWCDPSGQSYRDTSKLGVLHLAGKR